MLLSEIKLLSTSLEYSDEDEMMDKLTSKLISNEKIIEDRGIYSFCFADDCYYIRKIAEPYILGLANIVDGKLIVIFWRTKYRNGKSLPVFFSLLKRHKIVPLEISHDSEIFNHGKKLLQAILDRQPDFIVKRIDKDGTSFDIKNVSEIGANDKLIIEEIDGWQLMPSKEY